MADQLTPMPAMDDGGFKCFSDHLSRSSCFLEYGCGGSTLYATNVAKVPVIVSVDTDRRWVEKVRESVKDHPGQLFIEHCDLGEVGGWGVPVNEAGFKNFWTYAAGPWETARRHNLKPDTVLVDGRFRVASFLYSLLKARVGTTILFDDYLNRPEYFVVEEFCRLVGRHGRMGVFQVGTDYAVADLCQRFAQYSVIWD